MALKHKELIDKLSLEEKCSLLSGMNFWETEKIRNLVPSAFLSDGPSGLRKQGAKSDNLGLNGSIPAVCMPSAATLANSFDPEVTKLAGTTIGEEAVVADVSLLLGPGMNMKRNPRCGRNFEYFAEDPYLAGKMAAGFVNGVQSNGIGSCVKHFAANNQEIRRMMSDSIVDERALREIYLTAFEIAVKEANPKAVMSSYNRLNGSYANQNYHLLREILRDDWKYEGIVVSDWGGNDDRVEALKASDDLEMPTPDGETDYEVLCAVREGKIPESLVDESVDRLLDWILSCRPALENHAKDFDHDGHHAAAQKAAEESLVLLKNKDDLLPLKSGTKIAVIGDFAKNSRYQGAGSSIVNALHVDQILDVLPEYDLDIVGFEQGFDRYGKKKPALVKKALALADKADVILLFMGLDEVTEAEGMDRENIQIPLNQRELLSSLYKTGKKIAVVLECGSAVELPFVDRVDAILHAYLSGEAGARAIMNILTGKVNPSGKLSESYPFGYEDCPSADHFGKSDRTIQYRESIFIGYRYFNTSGTEARFPFGYGLSYTKFEYSDLKVSDKGVSFKLKNVGQLAGKEAAQLYIGKKESKVFRPKVELKGFQKVELQPGEEKEVEIPFDDYSFRYWNVKTNKFEVEGGKYQIYVGPNSMEFPLIGEIELEGTGAPDPYEIDKIPLYMSGEVRSVPDDQFREVLGREIPENAIFFVKKNRIVVDYNTPTCDLRYSKGWAGRFFAWVMRHLISFLRKIGKRALANGLIMGVYYNPTRAFSRMSGAAFNYDQLDGLILMFNGHFFKGLGHLISAGKRRKKNKKARQAAIKASGEEMEKKFAQPAASAE